MKSAVKSLKAVSSGPSEICGLLNRMPTIAWVAQAFVMTCATTQGQLSVCVSQATASRADLSGEVDRRVFRGHSGPVVLLLAPLEQEDEPMHRPASSA